MIKVADGDSHFMEPLDLFERYIDPAWRERTVRMAKESESGQPQMLVDGRPMKLRDVDEVLGLLSGYGQKEEGYELGTFDRYIAYSAEWQNMDKRVRFLDDEGIDVQVIYPSLGIIWEGEVDDPGLADALCRAYNTWAFEVCENHRNRLFPAAHISMRDSQSAVREMQRVAKLGARTIFVAAAPIKGHSFGHTDFDPIWASAQDLDLAVGIHLVSHRHYTGSQWYKDPKPGLMYFSMNLIQDPRMALTTMVIDGVFERYPRLRVATIEAMSGWVGEWLERLDYRYRYMSHTSQMKRSASEYFARNIWVSADPEEKMLQYIVDFAGDERFFIGSDYPHAEGFVHPIEKARQHLEALPPASVNRILCDNPRAFYRF